MLKKSEPSDFLQLSFLSAELAVILIQPYRAGYSGKVKSVWTVVAALASVHGDHCLFAASTLYQVMLSDRRNRGGLRSLHALAFGDDQANLVAQI